MSVNEIMHEIEKLSPEELDAIQAKLDQVRFPGAVEETPEMLAAIDEGLRSLREEPTMTLDELRAEMRTWTLDTK